MMDTERMMHESAGECGECEECRSAHGIETAEEWRLRYPKGSGDDPKITMYGCDICARGKGVYSEAHVAHYIDRDTKTLEHIETCWDCLRQYFA